MNGLWLVCFTGRKECVRWWDWLRITSQDFRHCYVIQYQPDAKRWVLMDWRAGMMDLIAFDHDELKYILGQLKATGGTGILYKAEIPEDQIFFRIPLIWCVPPVLQVLGLPTRFTMTPKQLYKRLMKLGGQELVNYRR